MCGLFEKRLKESNPDRRQITYDVQGMYWSYAVRFSDTWPLELTLGGVPCRPVHLH